MNKQIYLLSGLLIACGGSTASAAENENSPAVVRLQLVEYVAPEFPRRAQTDGVFGGMTVVAFSHDAAGRVNDVLALESTHPAFAQEAIEAVQQWRVAPHGENAVECQRAHVIRFNFRAGGIVYVPANPSRAGRLNPRANDVTYNLVTFDDLVSRPKPLKQTPPALSADLQARSGVVRVTFFVDDRGRVRVPSVISAPDPALAAAVVKGLAQWRYEPPRRDGHPVIAMEQVELGFNVADPKAVAGVR